MLGCGDCGIVGLLGCRENWCGVVELYDCEVADCVIIRSWMCGSVCICGCELGRRASALTGCCDVWLWGRYRFRGRHVCDC